MTMRSTLADLEALALSVPNATARVYAQEAVACYTAGAFRASIVSIWIAVTYDLYSKVE